MRPVHWFILILIVVVGGGTLAYGDRGERRLAEAAVRNVAGEARTYWVVKGSWPGLRTTLWCAGVARPDGLVAVTTRRSRIPGFDRVTEVAPAWVEDRTPRENQMLDKCWERVR